MSILGELKRRKVFQVAVAYLVVAWAIMQVVDVINVPLNLPAWFATVVILLLAIGFPIAILFSWAFDVTSGGVVRDRDSRQTERGEAKDGSPTQRSVAPLGIDYGKATFWVVVVLAVALVGSLFLEQSSPDLPRMDRTQDTSLRWFTIDLPRNMRFDDNQNHPFTISADGRRIVFFAAPGGNPQLFSRALDKLDVQPIPGTENAERIHALAPDSQWIAFVDNSDSLMKKVPITGGIPVTLCDPGGVVWNISWGAKGDIVFSTASYPGLMRVSASGGLPEKMTTPSLGDIHKQPAFSPDGETMLFAIGERGRTMRSTDRIAALSLVTNEQKTLIAGASPQVMTNGNLVYFQQNALWIVEFDADGLALNGDSVPVSGDVLYSRDAHYSVSEDGTLVYVLSTELLGRNLAWVDQLGNETALDFEPQPYNAPRVSPDGESMAVVVFAENGADLWIYSIERGTSDRLTFDDSRETRPLWSPDGQHIVYSSNRIDDLFRVATDGTGRIEQLTDNPLYQVPNSISPDGKQILFSERGPEANSLDLDARSLDLSVYTFSADPMTEILLQSDFVEKDASFSPDGRWMTYTSNRTGQDEIYLRPFPDVDTSVHQISVEGGRQSIWDSAGNRLFYWGNSNMMSVAIDLDHGISVGVPEPLFSHEGYEYTAWRAFDWDPNRSRFLMVKKPSEADTPNNRIIVVQNWLDSVTAKLESD